MFWFFPECLWVQKQYKKADDSVLLVLLKMLIPSMIIIMAIHAFSQGHRFHL